MILALAMLICASISAQTNFSWQGKYNQKTLLMVTSGAYYRMYKEFGFRSASVIGQITYKPGIVSHNSEIPLRHPNFARSYPQHESIVLNEQSNVETPKVKDRGLGFVWDAEVKIRGITGTPPPSSGNWTINDTTIVEDSTLIINGSIIVNEMGTLILKNSTIYMNLSYDGEYWIDIYGNLTVLGSLITAYNTSNNYFIRVFSGAKLRIENSEITYAGYEWGTDGDHSGLYIRANGAKIINTTIHDGYYGVTIWNGSDIMILGSTFSNIW